MPEATMDKDYLLAAEKDQIRTAWQIFPMKSKATAKSMGCSTHDHLRFGVFPTDPTHQR
jgi:hypothetical protein